MKLDALAKAICNIDETSHISMSITIESLDMATGMADSKQTMYFGYGSNLWLEQMHIRCPHSKYMGIARLNNYRWLINDRRYANVVAASKDGPIPTAHADHGASSSISATRSEYAAVVFGLVYSLTAADEGQLDRNEGVPVAYTKEMLACDFWPATSASLPIDTRKPPEKVIDMLVYIDRLRITPDKPRKEYIYRMNRGIEDAIKAGVPEKYVEDIMRSFIPEEKHDDESNESIGGFAREQARQFRDESGVFQ
ncbi:hypothetical protein ACN47E_006781 [Coniothyrium glycines]